MSDNWIIVIPEVADYLPSEEAQRKAVALFKKLAPAADEVKAEATTGVRFIDCGANFERVLCPDCGAEIQMDWWQDRMGEEAEAGFPLRRIALTCCGVTRNLNELRYDWSQGFARFSLEAMNAGISDLTDEHLKAFAKLLGCRVRKVLQHV